jgi:hypothetical protein
MKRFTLIALLVLIGSSPMVRPTVSLADNSSSEQALKAQQEEEARQEQARIAAQIEAERERAIRAILQNQN